MTAGEFYTAALANSGASKEDFDSRYVVLVCRCGEPGCLGWVLSLRQLPIPAAERAFCAGMR